MAQISVGPQYRDPDDEFEYWLSQKEASGGKMTKRYLIWSYVKPRREDAPKLRRLWATLRKRGSYDYNYRRRLAHDYAVAKCADDRRKEAGAVVVSARSVGPGEEKE